MYSMNVHAFCMKNKVDFEFHLIPKKHMKTIIKSQEFSGSLLMSIQKSK